MRTAATSACWMLHPVWARPPGHVCCLGPLGWAGVPHAALYPLLRASILRILNAHAWSPTLHMGHPLSPSGPLQVLTEHRDEVWHLAFSPTGAMLASASKDGCAVVYDVRGRGAVAARHTLRKHAGAVAFLCWSPDGSQLATCGGSPRCAVRYMYVVCGVQLAAGCSILLLAAPEGRGLLYTPCCALQAATAKPVSL